GGGKGWDGPTKGLPGLNEDGVKVVPFVVLRGPEVTQERWEILFRQGPLEYEELQQISFREDVGGIALRGKVGSEREWREGDREPWLDHLLTMLLPLVEFVELKQSGFETDYFYRPNMSQKKLNKYDKGGELSGERKEEGDEE
ncbi:unnamed protein product, partial [Choristocarpus tenellus]